MTKPFHTLQSMKDDDVDVFMSSMIDRYKNRPNSLEHLSYIEFGCWYKTYTKTHKHDDNDSSDDDYQPIHVCNNDNEYTNNKLPEKIKLQNNLGNMSKRTMQICHRFHNVSQEANSEMFFHRLLI